MADGIEPSPKEIRRMRRREVSRAQILDVAGTLFGTKGFHATSLKDVADECEFSVGSIYSFFASKDELYEAVLTRYGRGELDEMASVAERADNAMDRLVSMARLQIDYFRTRPSWGLLVIQILTPAARTRTPQNPGLGLFATEYDEAMQMQAALIRQGQSEGTIRTGDSYMLAQMFSAMVTTFHALDFAEASAPGTGDVEEFLALVDHAFRA